MKLAPAHGGRGGTACQKRLNSSHWGLAPKHFQDDFVLQGNNGHVSAPQHEPKKKIRNQKKTHEFWLYIPPFRKKENHLDSYPLKGIISLKTKDVYSPAWVNILDWLDSLEFENPWRNWECSTGWFQGEPLCLVSRTPLRNSRSLEKLSFNSGEGCVFWLYSGGSSVDGVFICWRKIKIKVYWGSEVLQWNK